MDPGSSYVYGFSFGQLLPVGLVVFCVFSEFQLFAQGWMGIDEGWIFGEWETGPWLGFRLSFFLQQLSNTQLFFFFFQLPYTYIGLFLQIPYTCKGCVFCNCHILALAVFFTCQIVFRSTEKEAGSYSWLGFGDGAGGDHMVGELAERVLSWSCLFQVWRHTCILIDFLEGRTAFFENGEKLFEKKDVKVL